MAGFLSGLFGKAVGGDAVKGALEGGRDLVGGIAKDIREAVTGEGHNLDMKKLDVQVAEIDKALALAQAEVTKAEAQGNPFQRSWRPGLAWMIIIALGLQYAIYPLALWICTWADVPPPPVPTVDVKDLWPIILGLIGYRTIEKARGVAGG